MRKYNTYILCVDYLIFISIYAFINLSLYQITSRLPRPRHQLCRLENDLHSLSNGDKITMIWKN